MKIDLGFRIKQFIIYIEKCIIVNIHDMFLRFLTVLKLNSK